MIGEWVKDVRIGGGIGPEPAGNLLQRSGRHPGGDDRGQHPAAAPLERRSTADDPGRENPAADADDDYRLAAVAERPRDPVAAGRAVVLHPAVYPMVERADDADRADGDGGFPPTNVVSLSGNAWCHRQLAGDRDPKDAVCTQGVARSVASTSIVMRTSSPTICAPSIKRFNVMP